MASPEGAGRPQGLFRIDAPPRGRTATPVLPRPDTAPRVPQPEKPPTRKSLIKRLANSLALRIVLAGTALAGTGYAGYEAYQNTPAVHQAVDQEFLQRLGLKEAPVPSTFDNAKDKQLIGDNNLTRITPKEAEEKDLLVPKLNIEDGQVKAVTRLFPFILPSNATTAQDKTPYSVRGTEFTNSRFVLPENTGITFPKGTSVIFIKGEAEAAANIDSINTIIAIYPYTNENIFQQWQINVSGGASNIHTEALSLTPSEFLDLLTRSNWDNSQVIKDSVVTISDGTTPLAFIQGGEQQVSLNNLTLQGARADSTAQIIRGVEDQFTTDSNGKLITLTPAP